jgi:hypothetical protein
MGKFVLCASFLEGCASDPGLFADVLFEFPKDNRLTVCVDAPNGRVLEGYKAAAGRDKNNLISAWLYCIINRPALSIESVDIAVASDRLRYIELALGLAPDVPLVVWSVYAWKGALAPLPEVVVMDRMDGRTAIKRAAKANGGPAMTQKDRRGSKGSVNIQGHIVNVGNINSDNARATVNNTVSRAILDMEELVGGDDSPGVREALKQLEQELRKPVPDKGRLQTFWDSLVAIAPSVASIASAASAVAAIIGHP